MAKDQPTTKNYYIRRYVTKDSGWSFAYCLGIIGAAVFYVQQATTFGAVLVGLLKALVWPAFLVYHLLH